MGNLELNGKLTDEHMSGICDGEPGKWGEVEVRVRVLGEIEGIFPMTNPAKRQSENYVSSWVWHLFRFTYRTSIL